MGTLVGPSARGGLLIHVEISLDHRPSRFEPFQLHSLAEIDKCLDQARRVIELAEWLTKEAAEELEKYRQFTQWIRSGVCTCLGLNS